MNLNLHYTLTQDDYLKAQDLFARHNSLMSRAVVHASPVFGVLLIAAAILNLWNAPRSWLSSFLCVFWGMFLLLWRRFSLARTFMKEKRLHQQFDVVIDDQGVELSNANGKTVSLWSAFDKFAESDGIFLLFCGQRTFHLIPKRAFASGQERQLRELLREKIPSRR